ncbi:hypothetical protein D3C76_1617150 [compost metagenome]
MPQGCRRIDQWIECQQAEVHRHQLDDRAHATQRRANACADESQFRQGGVANALWSEFVQ